MFNRDLASLCAVNPRMYFASEVIFKVNIKKLKNDGHSIEKRKSAW